MILNGQKGHDAQFKPFILQMKVFLLEKELLMSNEKIVNINAAWMPVQEDKLPTLVKKIGKTTYRVTIHFSTTSRETMSDKIKRMFRNEVSRM